MSVFFLDLCFMDKVGCEGTQLNLWIIISLFYSYSFIVYIVIIVESKIFNSSMSS